MALGKFDDFVAYLVRKADSTLAKVKSQSIIAQMISKTGVASTFDKSTDSLEAIRDAIDTLVLDIQGLAYFGIVTTYTDTTHFKVAGLAGYGNDFFVPAGASAWEIYVVWDAAGAGAAPQGEQTPVVDYTSLDGTFQHAAFTAPLAVGDIVIILHPSIAALGTKATAAAAGAVTTADYLMAYIKQIINEINGGTWTKFNNVTITSLNGALQALAGIFAAASTNVFNPTIQGVARTDMETALNSLASYLSASGAAMSIQVNNQTARTNIELVWEDFLAVIGCDGTNVFNPTIDGAARTTLETALAAIDAVNQRLQGLVVYGSVTTATSTTQFADTKLAGYGNGHFYGWWVTPVWDAGGAHAAPQAEWRQISAYVSATGLFTHSVFSAQLAVTDKVKIVSPEVFEAMAMRGGAVTIQDLLDNQQAMLDMAEYPTISVVCDGNEQTVYEMTGADVPFFFAGGFIDWTGANAGAGEDTTVKVYVKVDGTNYRYIYSETFLAAAVPDPIAVPFPRSVDTRPTPEGFYCKQDVKVTVQQAAEGGGWNTLDVRTIDAVRGG